MRNVLIGLAVLLGIAVGAYYILMRPRDLMPRYAWEPGAKIVYRTLEENTDENTRYIQKCQWDLWVIDVNDAGAHHVIYQKTGTRTTQYQSSGTSESAIQEWGRFTLHPDGGLSEVMPDQEHYYLRLLLPFVPLSEDESRTYAIGDLGIEGRVYGLRFFGTVRHWAQYQIEERIQHSPLMVFNRSMEVAWRPRYGAPASIASYYEHVEFPAINSKSTSRLRSVGKASRHERNKILPDIKRFLAAVDQYHSMYFEHYHARPRVYEERAFKLWSDDFEPIVAPLQAAWRGTRHDGLRGELEQMIGAHKRHRSHTVDAHREILQTIGEAAPDWELEDFQGVTHRLEDYRGRVLLLDFWAHWCPPCIKALPIIKEIEQRFEDAPVTIIGMNIDREDSLDKAQEIISIFDIRYPVLKAKSLSEVYPIHSFPTFIVIDGDGVMRHHHAGFSETLKDDLMAVIERHMPGDKPNAQGKANSEN